ncbi:MAG: ABC transporter permease [Rubellimicrobium sp.]|nr:ABC transporter permease [Rubellimicrobium sp.]
MKSSRWAKVLRLPEVSSFGILCLVVVAFVLGNRDFLSPLNISNMLAFLPELGIIALAMTLLLTAGEFDLSVGAVFALCPVTMALLVQNAGMSFTLALLIGFLIAVAVGLINGLLVTKIGISSFLVTLSMLFVVRGVALYATQGFPLKSLEVDNAFVNLLVGNAYIGPFRIYASFWWFIAFVALAIYVLDYSKAGNWISAVGSNRDAAVARGVPADRVKIWLFVITSVAAGFAGLISALRISSASPVAGTNYELEVIAMVVVGGTALMGGRGTIFGTLVGIFMLRIIRNGIVMVGVPGLAYNIFVGAIILVMLVMHALMQRRHGRA